MNYVKSAFTSVSTFYREMNPSTLSGAIDVLVVREPDGSLVGSPFHVRFGKLQLLRPNENRVDISVNGRLIDIHMKVGDAGEAFFVVETSKPVPEAYVTSPIHSPSAPPDLTLSEKFEALDLNATTTTTTTTKTTTSTMLGGGSVALMSSRGASIPASPAMFANTDDTPSADADFLLPPSSLPESDGLLSFAATDRVPSAAPETTADHQQQQQQQPAIATIVESKSLVVAEADAGSPHDHWTWGWGGLPRRDNEEGQLETPPPPFTVSPRPSVSEGPLSSTPGSAFFADTPTSAPLSASSAPVMRTTTSPSHSVAGSPPPTSALPRAATEGNFSLGSSASTGALPSPRIQHSTSSILPPSNRTANDTVINVTASPKRISIAPITDIPDHFLPPAAISPTPSSGGEDSTDLNELDVSMSLCGDQLSRSIVSLEDSEAALELFEKHRVRFEDFVSNPFLINNPNLVLLLDDRLFRWNVAAPYLMSLLVYRRRLPKDTLKSLIIDDINTMVAKGGEKPRSNWRISEWLFGKKPGQPTGVQTQHQQQSSNQLNLTYSGEMDRVSNPAVSPRGSINGEAGSEQAFPSANPHQHPASSSPIVVQPTPATNVKHNYAKSLRLTNEQLQSLDLQPGANKVVFTVSTSLQGTASCTANIYLWNHDVRIVISDIDGTITKSDTLGHIFTAVGKDWTHSGVANLYSNIAKNGYQILYLTSRAIGQSNYTREFLKWVEQSGGWRLPEGPVICAPDRLLQALHREVIQRRPQDFKMSVLKDLKRLFKAEHPFYAGFGNRETDAMSYKAVDVPEHRIFTINPKGDIKVEMAETFRFKYLSLNDIVNQMFPPLTEQSKEINESFSDFNYWRQPLPPLDDELDNDYDEDEYLDVNDDGVEGDFDGDYNEDESNTSTSNRKAASSTAAAPAAAAKPEPATGGYPFYD